MTDGQLVYAWFGTGQIVALDMNGKLVWERNLGQGDLAVRHQLGTQQLADPLSRTLLILICDHDPASYLLAVDKKTGKERWKADRGKGRQSYTTPFVVQTAGGAELVVNSSQRVDAYDPKNGTLLWHVGGSNQFPIPSPTFHDGVIYLTRGYRSGPYMAIRPGGRGDVSNSHVIWQVNTGAPYISSLVYDGGLLYMANDVGGITVIEADTGKRLWQERVGGTLFRVAGRGRRQDLLRQRDGRGHRAALGTRAGRARAQRRRRAPDGVAGHLERTDLPQKRRPADRHRQAADVEIVRRARNVHWYGWADRLEAGMDRQVVQPQSPDASGGLVTVSCV